MASCAPRKALDDVDDVSKSLNLTRALLEKGYSEPDIRKIYGGNVASHARRRDRSETASAAAAQIARRAVHNLPRHDLPRPTHDLPSHDRKGVVPPAFLLPTSPRAPESPSAP
jgi:hypothetical protein